MSNWTKFVVVVVPGLIVHKRGVEAPGKALGEGGAWHLGRPVVIGGVAITCQGVLREWLHQPVELGPETALAEVWACIEQVTFAFSPFGSAVLEPNLKELIWSLAKLFYNLSWGWRWIFPCSEELGSTNTDIFWTTFIRILMKLCGCLKHYNRSLYEILMMPAFYFQRWLEATRSIPTQISQPAGQRGTAISPYSYKHIVIVGEPYFPRLPRYIWIFWSIELFFSYE